MTDTIGRMLGADFAWPLWDQAVTGEPFTFTDPDAPLEDLVLRTVARPICFGFAPARANGGAVLICAGGGYTQLVIGKEGVEIAGWLTRLGFHAFVLAHRFPNADGGAQVPVDDAIEAMRLIRAPGQAMGISRVGAIGLSSGGHLAAALATRRCDAPKRPDFLIIGYAPISTNAVGRTVVVDKPPLAPAEKQSLYDAVQPDAHLASDPPPAFIFYAANDKVVPAENARRLHAAYAACGGSAELHIFADAPHGLALRTADTPAGQWPVLCAAWLKRCGML